MTEVTLKNVDPRVMVSRSCVAGALAADGSLVVPPDVLAGLGWAAGDDLILESDGDSLLVRRADGENLPTRSP